MDGLRVGFGCPGMFVAGTRENGKARVLGIDGIGGGTLAEEELRSFGGFDGAGVEAGSAESRICGARRIWSVCHEERIARGLAGSQRGTPRLFCAESAQVAEKKRHELTLFGKRRKSQQGMKRSREFP